jgi:hypothetical protein
VAGLSTLEAIVRCGIRRCRRRRYGSLVQIRNYCVYVVSVRVGGRLCGPIIYYTVVDGLPTVRAKRLRYKLELSDRRKHWRVIRPYGES